VQTYEADEGLRTCAMEFVDSITGSIKDRVRALAAEASGKADAGEGRAKLVSVQRKIEGIMCAIEDGLYQPSMKARLTELDVEKAGVIAPAI
jgi:site-specific DNA recombinase